VRGETKKEGEPQNEDSELKEQKNANKQRFLRRVKGGFLITTTQKPPFTPKKREKK